MRTSCFSTCSSPASRARSVGRDRSGGRVVFVTAFDQYAVRAFEVNALDYLLKPVAPARLARAVERLGHA